MDGRAGRQRKAAIVTRLHLEYHHHIDASALSSMLRLIEDNGFGYQLRAIARPWRPKRRFRTSRSISTGSDWRAVLVLRCVCSNIGDAQHIGRAGRSERNTGNDDHALPGFRETFLHRDVAGTLDHVVLVMRILGDDAMDAPDNGKAPSGRDIGRQRDDRGAWPLAGYPQASRAGRRPADNGR